MTTPRHRSLLPLACVLALVTAVALLGMARAIDDAPVPRLEAALPETPTAILMIRYETLLVTPVPTPHPTRAPTSTPPPWRPRPTPTETFRPERQTQGRTETS